MLAAPTSADLATFTGRAEATLGAYADQALEQAALMFTIGTKLSDYPTDPDQEKLARFAIMEMADRLLLEQPFAGVKASPYQSETIGSWSYSRATQTAKTVSQGLKTGLFWWDTALAELSQVNQTVSAHGSIKVQTDGLEEYEADSYRIVNQADDELPPYARIS